MIVEIPDRFFSEEELLNTPKRIQRFMDEWSKDDEFKFTTFDNTEKYNQMIILKEIEFNSLCSHHLLPFHGKAHIGYVPDNKICGISKLARLVDLHAHKPQIQEKLTNDIINDMVVKLNPLGCIVILEAAHDCMRIRGVKKQNSIMSTSAIHGVFEKESTRIEFLKVVFG